ncbi:glycoside hydrolase family 2 protein [Myriangium duriaei CBS 260.36]|uniref:Beta-mannosidase B n=1 Tax=Myriangium duriaei CBS 260.36 TaxID=1168546 RepID=A0A9P4IXS1_9PEZI|nr:glycoside hydrolase family 2 protein [Myriangium duriaei CBS 260.36]
MTSFRRSLLQHGWQFKDGSLADEKWTSVSSVPSVVQLDLFNAGKIPDPFEATNELDVEWIGERQWIYRLQFLAPKLDKSEEADLVLEGLDTLATVYLNRRVILKSDNMFISHRVSVKEYLLSGQDNTLTIVFDSALLRGRELEKEHTEHRFIAHNGETGRLGIRKAQYHWGWDWGPVLMTAGPWRPIALETYQSRIEDVWVVYVVDEDLTRVRGTLHALTLRPAGDLTFKLEFDGVGVVCLKGSKDDEGVFRAPFSIQRPRLWYPSGYGKQSRYTLSAELAGDHGNLHKLSKETGFRRTELVRKPDRFGESFYFRVNNLDIFCGGSCWIPADNFLPRLTADDYRQWLQCMRDGNQVMVRVWGGGIYEHDSFYSICDELGLLVWQDFMFACGSYPVWPEMLENIKREAIHNCRRLRHHPCVIIYAGNNEDYQIQEQYGLDYKQSDRPQDWLKSNFPARYIYEHMLPAVVAEETTTAYWPCSPFTGGGKPSSDLTKGDVHQWNVWHGSQEKYQRFADIGGRFNSEFGMASFPVMSTIESFVKDESELYPSSRTLDFHNKADGHERRIATYVLENFRNAADLETWVYLTQLTQSETMLYAYRDWRRQWGHSRKCGGALVWQLNDCWPCSSWAIVDYYRRKKPAYYATKRILKPVAIGIRRKHHDWSVCHARPVNTLPFDVWVMSNQAQSVKGNLEVRFVSVRFGKDTRDPLIYENIDITSNGTTEVLQDTVDSSASDPIVLAAKLFVGGECISRDFDWPQPYKYLPLAVGTLKMELDRQSLRLSTDKPIKGIVFEERDDIALIDNGIDLVPGDDRVIDLSGFKGRVDELRWKSLI